MTAGFNTIALYSNRGLCGWSVWKNSHGFNSKDLDDFFRLKLEMETREEKYKWEEKRECKGREVEI